MSIWLRAYRQYHVHPVVDYNPRDINMKGIFLLQDVREDQLINPQSLLFYYQTMGWFGGGYDNVGYTSSVISITFSSDTNVASLRGPLTLSRIRLGGMGTLINGYMFGGYTGAAFSTVDKITYAVDTNISIVKGSLTYSPWGPAGVGNNTYGWIGGGENTSNVCRLTYSNDTAQCVARGILPNIQGDLAGV